MGHDLSSETLKSLSARFLVQFDSINQLIVANLCLSLSFSFLACLGTLLLIVVFPISGELHVCFLSTRFIMKGEQLLIDYGERRRSVVATHRWLSK